MPAKINFSGVPYGLVSNAYKLPTPFNCYFLLITQVTFNYVSRVINI